MKRGLLRNYSLRTLIGHDPRRGQESKQWCRLRARSFRVTPDRSHLREDLVSSPKGAVLLAAAIRPHAACALPNCHHFLNVSSVWTITTCSMAPQWDAGLSDPNTGCIQGKIGRQRTPTWDPLFYVNPSFVDTAYQSCPRQPEMPVCCSQSSSAM